MTDHSLTVAAFAALLDTHGADLAVWPDDQRRAAQELLAESEEAAAVLAEATILHKALKSSRTKAPDGLVDRILAASGAGKPQN